MTVPGLGTGVGGGGVVKKKVGTAEQVVFIVEESILESILEPMLGHSKLERVLVVGSGGRTTPPARVN